MDSSDENIDISTKIPHPLCWSEKIRLVSDIGAKVQVGGNIDIRHGSEGERSWVYIPSLQQHNPL